MTIELIKKPFSEDYQINGVDFLRQPFSEDYKINDFLWKRKALSNDLIIEGANLEMVRQPFSEDYKINEINITRKPFSSDFTTELPQVWIPFYSNSECIIGGVSKSTHVRNSSATFTNPDTGLIETAGTNIPRFELVGGHRAILIEPADSDVGKNLIHYSHELDNGWWSRSRLTTISANGMLAPDGNTVADGLVANGDSNTHYIRNNTLLPGISSGDKVAFTGYAKIGDKNWVFLQVLFHDVGGVYLGDQGGYYFNVLTGNIGDVSEVGNATVHDYMIEETANGFYRIGVIVSNNDANTSKINFRFNSAVDNAPATAVFTGTGSVNTWLWGADLEKQAFFGSYVPTSGGTASRATESSHPFWTLPTGLFDAKGTLSVWVRFSCASSDDIGNHGILTTRDSGAASLLYVRAVENELWSYDGTNTGKKGLVFANNTWYKPVVKWGYGASKMRVGVDTGSGVSWGTEVNFDGSYSLGDYLRLGFGLFGPMWMRDLRLYDRVLGDTEINAGGSPP